jgi:hypothetical protein
MIRRGHYILREHGVTGEVRFVNKVFGLPGADHQAETCRSKVNATEPLVGHHGRVAYELKGNVGGRAWVDIGHSAAGQPMSASCTSLLQT